MHRFGRRRGIGQYAVNAVAQAQALFKRFNVNITRAVFDGLNENQIRQFDDGCFFAGSGELINADLFQSFLGNFQRVGVVRLAVASFLRVENDVFDALTDKTRRYRDKEFTIDEALELMKSEFIDKSLKIDPILFTVFLDYINNHSIIKDKTLMKKLMLK